MNRSKTALPSTEGSLFLYAFLNFSIKQTYISSFIILGNFWHVFYTESSLKESVMTDFDEIQSLLQERANCYARINLIPYDGSPKIKENKSGKYYLFWKLLDWMLFYEVQKSFCGARELVMLSPYERYRRNHILRQLFYNDIISKK